MASLRARMVRWITAKFVKRIDAETADVNELRASLQKIVRFTRKARRVSVEETEVNGLHAEWLRPDGAPGNKVLLYLHGGAYLVGNCSTHRQMVSYIARSAGINALLPEYRLAPEHPFPAAIDDAVGVYRTLLADGFSSDDIFIAGDSAGGGLSVATMLSLRHAGVPLPAAAVLLSPFLDLTASGETARTRAAQDPWFDAKDVPVVARHYCPDESDLTNPLISPVFANVAGLPPTCIQVGDDEILLSDSMRFSDKMKEAGSEVELEIWPDMWHVFQIFIGKMPEARRAIEKIGVYLRSRAGAQPNSEA